MNAKTYENAKRLLLTGILSVTLLVAAMMSGCAFAQASNNIKQMIANGTTYSDVVSRQGPPSSSTKLPDGRLVAQWRRVHPLSTVYEVLDLQFDSNQRVIAGSYRQE